MGRTVQALPTSSLQCIGPSILSELLLEVAKFYTMSGFPDLILWHPEKCVLKIIEVKGPGDRLSEKQMIWIDILLQMGLDVSVCHVVAL